MATWTTRDANTGLAIAVEGMKRKVLDAARLAGVGFTLERDGKLVATYAAPAGAKPIASRGGSTYVRCTRCTRLVRPTPGTLLPASHVRPGTRDICKGRFNASHRSVKDVLADLSEDEQAAIMFPAPDDDHGSAADDQRDAERDLRAVFDAEEAQK